MKRAFIAPLSLLYLVLAPPASAAPEDGGELAFNNHCRQCHSMKESDHRLGPSLHGIAGAKGGQAAGFNNYSGALKDMTWDDATLDKFITNPASVATNTNMQFPGVANAEDRKKIIEFIKQSSPGQK